MAFRCPSSVLHLGVENFERACAEMGRDPSAVRRSWGGGCICMPTRAEAERLAGDRYDRDPEGDFDFG